MFPSESEPLTWEQSDFQASWADDYFGVDQRGREADAGRQNRSRSRSLEGPHHIVPPQYSISSPDIVRRPPDIRRTRNHSPQQHRPTPLNAHLRLPASEPMYHDVGIAHSRSFSPERYSSVRSQERLNLFPSPMQSPVLHRKESIEEQAKRAARAKPIKLSSPSAPNPRDSLLMFSDPADDTVSVVTGVSQQGLIWNHAEHAKRKEKKYPKQKDKKKGGVRILNLPSLKSSPTRRKYRRGIDQGGLPNEDVEQQPRKSLIARYSTGKRRKVALVEPAEDGVERRKSWRRMSSLSVRSDDQDSTQSSQEIPLLEGPEVDNTITYASMPVKPSRSKMTSNDLLAQAAENWIKSNEETRSAQFSVDAQLLNIAREDNTDMADVLDQVSASTNGSDDERPTEEDGAFPSLADVRPNFGPSRLSFEESMEETQWQNKPSSTEWFESNDNQDTRNILTWDGVDKMSEESPVSVMAVHGTDRRFFPSAKATPTAQRTALPPPREKTTTTLRKALAPPPGTQKRPTSILRKGRHSGTKEVSEKISARVKFHEEALELQRANQASIARVGAHQSSEPDIARCEASQEEKVTNTLSSQNWTEVFERDDSVLSAIPESAESIQTETSEAQLTESNDVAVEFPDGSEHDKEWTLGEHEQGSFGDFAEFEVMNPSHE